MFRSNYFKKFKIRFTAYCLIATAILSACDSSDNTSKNASMDTVKNMSAASSEDWVSLFDGKTFTGWHTYAKPHVELNLR